MQYSIQYVLLRDLYIYICLPLSIVYLYIIYIYIYYIHIYLLVGYALIAETYCRPNTHRQEK